MENVNVNVRRNQLIGEINYWTKKLAQYCNEPFAEPAKAQAEARIAGARREIIQLQRNGGASMR